MTYENCYQLFESELDKFATSLSVWAAVDRLVADLLSSDSKSWQQSSFNYFSAPYFYLAEYSPMMRSEKELLFVLCVCVCASVRPSIHNKKELDCFVRSTKSKWRSWQYSTNKYSDRDFFKDYFRYAVVKGKSKSLTSRIPTFAQKFNGRRDNFFV